MENKKKPRASKIFWIKDYSVEAEGTSLIKKVTREDVAEVGLQWTGIPIMKMLQEGKRKTICIWKKNYTDA
jgi:ATP-dependent Clp protease ATP-binding subunit ClpA